MQATEERWLTKEEAAKVLGMSIRHVERLAAAGQIEKRHVSPGAGTRYGGVHYLGSSVEAVLKERQEGIHAPVKNALAVVAPTQLARVPPLTPRQKHLFDTREIADQALALSAIPWLTLDQASEYSGLTKAWLLREAQGAGIAIRDMGKKSRGGAWRFFRADLEKAQ